MSFNVRLETLQQYPFERLRALTAAVTPAPNLRHIPLSLGEPKHPPPDFVIRALSDSDTLTQALSTYPVTIGSEDLRRQISQWITRRFDVHVDVEREVLPVNGTREALFSIAQALLSGKPESLVMLPNPFYQIYEGAALLAGAKPYFVNNDPEAGYQQDFDSIPQEVWEKTELIYLCSPGNPTGHIMPQAQLQSLIELAHQYDFYIVSDECYSELYFDQDSPPQSLLNASADMSNSDYSRCLVFHSLSKRSNLPGLRSGFVAGDAKLLKSYRLYRTYHGCALPPHHQIVSALAWQDEAHVIVNRELYAEKFAAVSTILAPFYPLKQPAGGFYHWLEVPSDDQAFCQQLLAAQNVTVMPGSFLARDTEQGNPGTGHVRIAWVATLEDCVEAAHRLATFAQSLA